MTNLHTLVLSNNKLKRVDLDRWFGNITVHLHSLSLMNNSVGDFKDNVFSELPELEDLNLAFDNLRKVRLGWFGGTVPLKIFDVSSNKIVDFDINFIDKADQLGHLYLFQNELDCTNIRNILKNLRNLKVIDIFGNLHSDCRDELEIIARDRNIDIQV